MLKTWRNGEKAGVIQKIIENNFKILGRHLSQNILCLSTTEREALGSDYLSKGLRVYDTTLDKWFVYNGIDWEEAEKAYVFKFTTDDWHFLDIPDIQMTQYGIIIPYSTHLRENPTVEVYLKSGTESNSRVYDFVVDGYEINEDYKVYLWSDMPYEGKVVIK